MANEPTRSNAIPAPATRRTVRHSDYLRELADDPVHQRWVADIERQIKAGKFDTEPLDADGLREYLQRVRPS